MATSLLKEQVNRALYRALVAIASDMILHDKDKVKLPIAGRSAITRDALTRGAAIIAEGILYSLPTMVIPESAAENDALRERNLLVRDLLNSDTFIRKQTKYIYMLSVNVVTSRTYSELHAELCRRVVGYFFDFIGSEMEHSHTPLDNPDELVGRDKDVDDDGISH